MSNPDYYDYKDWNREHANDVMFHGEPSIFGPQPGKERKPLCKTCGYSEYSHKTNINGKYRWSDGQNTCFLTPCKEFKP